MGETPAKQSKLMSDPTSRDLIRLENYPNWYLVPTTGQLVFRKHVDGRSLKIRTGVVGKLNPKTGHVDGIARARKIVDAKLAEMSGDKSPDQIAREQLGITNPFIGDIWKEMFAEKTVGKKAGTVANYEKDWKHGMRGFMGTPPEDPEELELDKERYPHTIPIRPYMTVDQLTDQAIVRFKSWYLENQPERQFEKTYDFLKMLITFMVDRRYISKRPDITPLEDLDSIVKSRKRYEKAGRVYTEVEQHALLGAWESFLETPVAGTTVEAKTILAARSRLITALGLRGGLRASEITTRKLVDIDFKKKGVIRVWSDKNDEWREVPLVPETIAALKYQIEANAHLKSEWLCPMPSDPSRYISHAVLEKCWYRTRDFAHLSVTGPYDARFHDCRKTFATMTAELGWPVKVACEILDMTPDIYLKTYVDVVSLKVKTDFMLRDFGGAK